MTLAFRLKRLGAAGISSLPRMIGRSPRRGLRVLTYHSVGNRVDGDINSIYDMSPNEFERHMAALIQFSTAHSVPFVPFASNVAHGIAITFDDGYVDALTNVAPILTRHRIPFHVFVTSTKLESGDPRYMSQADLLELAKNPLASFGAHGHEHRPLTGMTVSDAERDLRRSRESLSEILGKEVSSMSYPFGMVDNHVRDAALRAGFTRAACSKWGFNDVDTDPMMLRRIDMWARDRRSTVRDKVAGNWNWFGRLT